MSDGAVVHADGVGADAVAYGMATGGAGEIAAASVDGRGQPPDALFDARRRRRRERQPHELRRRCRPRRTRCHRRRSRRATARSGITSRLAQLVRRARPRGRSRRAAASSVTWSDMCCSIAPTIVSRLLLIVRAELRHVPFKQPAPAGLVHHALIESAGAQIAGLLRHLELGGDRRRRAQPARRGIPAPASWRNC